MVVLLIRRGIMAPLDLASQLLKLASTTLCNLPSPYLGSLLCRVLSNSPFISAGPFLVTLEDGGLIPPWVVAYMEKVSHLEHFPPDSHFFQLH